MDFRVLLLTISYAFLLVKCSEPASKNKKKKDLRDYNDADLERLYEQWEENDDEPLEEDEKPEHKRAKPQVDMSQLNGKSPEEMLRMTKKGQPVMMFVGVSGNPSKEETEKVTALWLSSLYNNHIEAQNYVIEDNRALFMFKEGSQAWVAKDYLIQQDRCTEVTLEGNKYPGKAAENNGNSKSEL